MKVFFMYNNALFVLERAMLGKEMFRLYLHAIK
jgi:hypothetical protein